MVLAASIVGSGELIATTTLGAQVGYAALWLVLLSCVVKPVVQAELGRYTVASGETGLEGLNRVPGPRLGVSWLVWAWALMVFTSLVQVGGMFGGLAQVMNLLLPAVPVRLWVLVFVALTLALLLGGGYDRIERLALVKVGFFTLLTVLAALVLTRMPGQFSWGAWPRDSVPACRAAGSPRQSRSSGSRAWAPRSCSCTRTGASRRATRASSANGTTRPPGWPELAAGSG